MDNKSNYLHTLTTITPTTWESVLTMANSKPLNLTQALKVYSPVYERYISTYTAYRGEARQVGYFATAIGFSSKPEGGVVNYDLSSRRYMSDIEGLAKMLARGHSICGVPRTVADASKPRQFYHFMVDFDHATIPLDMMLTRVKLRPSIAYHTFSHTAKDIRYRFVYVMKYPLARTPDDFKTLYRQLMADCGISGYDINTIDIARICNGTNKEVQWCDAMIYYDGEHFGQSVAGGEWRSIVYHHQPKTKAEARAEEKPNPRWKIKVPYHSQRTEAIKTLRKWGVSEETITLWLGSQENGYIGGFKPFMEHYIPRGDIRDYCGYCADTDGNRDIRDGSPVYTLNRVRKHQKNSHIWQDGEHRWKKIYTDGLLRRKIYRRNNGAENADDLFFLLAYDWSKYFSPYRDNDHEHKAMKYGKFEFVEVFDGVMQGSIDNLEADEKTKSYIITKMTTTECKKKMVGKYRWQDEDNKVAEIVKNCTTIEEARALLYKYTDRTFSDERLTKLLWGEVLAKETRTEKNRRIFNENVDKKKKREWNYTQCVSAGFDGSFDTFVSYWKKAK